jgi:hypothetical protein
VPSYRHQGEPAARAGHDPAQERHRLLGLRMSKCGTGQAGRHATQYRNKSLIQDEHQCLRLNPKATSELPRRALAASFANRQGFETEKSKKCTRPAQKRLRAAANGRGGGAGSKTTPKSSSQATKNLQRLRNVDQYSVNAVVLENRSRSTSAIVQVRLLQCIMECDKGAVVE